MTAPTIIRLSDHGPWSRYSIEDEDPSRHVTVFATTRNGKLCIDHFICCRTSLHHWPELFEAWRGYRDIPDGFDLTEAGRAAFAEADAEWRKVS
jgi:hypothetical protein